MVRKYLMAALVVALMGPATAPARDRIHITHAYANSNAQSLKGFVWMAVSVSTLLNTPCSLG
jgi:hypothetical protein